MVDSVAAAGTPDEVRQKLEGFVDAGARHFIFTPAPGIGDADKVVHALLDDVIPAVREHAAGGA
jgi:alkanesulfonate monooxygenase SsuD/methylene tetrahydromethanopterin reductase-like flavin-dependent oxidoreductase (luciferase family)